MKQDPSFLETAASRLKRLFSTPYDEITMRGIATGAIVSRGLLTKLGALVMSADFGFGWCTGNGGTKTQATSSSTAVTLNANAGTITTVALTTAAGGEEVFTVNNTKVGVTDAIVVGTNYAGAGTPAITTKKNIAGTSFDIVITNLHASVALNAAVTINFALVKIPTA